MNMMTFYNYILSLLSPYIIHEYINLIIKINFKQENYNKFHIKSSTILYKHSYYIQMYTTFVKSSLQND